eukprot:gene1691-2220_t
MFAILSSLWKNHLRAEKIRRGLGSVDAEGLWDDGQIAQAEEAILLSQLQQAVLELPGWQREPVVLVYVEQMSYKEAATILDLPLGTVMSRLAAAKTALAARLNPGTDIVTDADLVAFVDGRLPAERRQEVVKLAHGDAYLAARIAVLTEGTPVLDDAFRPMLESTPAVIETKLRALADTQTATHPSPSRRWIIGGAAMAASFAVGAVSSRFLTGEPQKSDW